MAEFVFTSPGIKFKERDITFVRRNVGITTLGLVGETLKGPAFEAVYIEDFGELTTRFGGLNTKKFPNGSLQYHLPYVANSYLSQTNQLWVTRVLGLSGYEAGTAWALTLDAGVDSTTTGVSGSSTITTNVPFTSNSYLGVAISGNGVTGSTSTGYTKQVDNSFQQYVHEFTATTYSSSTGDGEVTDKVTLYTGTSYTEYENMVLAIIRSKATSTIPVNASKVTTFEADQLSISTNTTLIGAGDLFGTFVITAGNSGGTETYTVSLDKNSSSYLPNVIGYSPKDKNSKLWVEAIYPNLIEKLDADSYGYGVNTLPISGTSDNFTDYEITFQTPETPWVVSQLMGSTVNRLFKFISISDGDNANKEIKITIQNIDPITNEFDVIIRDFSDTDANPVTLEAYSRCNLIKGTNGYIAQKIGTSDGEYELKSRYVMLELDDAIPDGMFPAGFEGYMFKDYTSSATSDGTTSGIPPKIFYKTSYATTDKVVKNYLGISEHGYDGTSSSASGFNPDFFKYQGQDGFSKSKGFHMDSGATGTYIDGTEAIGEFEVGAGQIRTYTDTEDALNPYYNIKTRKFTLVPAGGFDGWDVHRTVRSNTDGFQQGGIYSGYPDSPTTVPKNDYQAWQTAIETFANPEEVTINLFATPGINWMDHSSLVQDTIDMIEDDRTDSLYIIDSPNIDISVSIGDNGKADVLASTQIANALIDTGIDSSYACTYFPWIQMRDTTNSVNLYLPPTGEVVKAIAFTDNVKFPWFAPAGLNRGVTSAIKSKYKLSLDARDILYKARINPMADFADSGTAIFGQKTLQIKESALDRINVRRLLLQIKVLISNIAVRLLFDQNDQATIDDFLSQANPILKSIKEERGLYDFKIKMDDTNNTTESMDRNELYGEIFLKPTRSLEHIGITFTITPTGASFDD